jgi:hypothetical protein
MRVYVCVKSASAESARNRLEVAKHRKNATAVSILVGE